MLKLNAGFSRKVGEPNFSSRGASVNVELELESHLIGDPSALLGRIQNLFELARCKRRLKNVALGRFRRSVEKRSAPGRPGWVGVTLGAVGFRGDLNAARANKGVYGHGAMG
jgi:hypothetical protein